jgi:hypothetical protein
MSCTVCNVDRATIAWQLSSVAQNRGSGSWRNLQNWRSRPAEKLAKAPDQNHSGSGEFPPLFNHLIAAHRMRNLFLDVSCSSHAIGRLISDQGLLLHYPQFTACCVSWQLGYRSRLQTTHIWQSMRARIDCADRSQLIQAALLKKRRTQKPLSVNK